MGHKWILSLLFMIGIRAEDFHISEHVFMRISDDSHGFDLYLKTGEKIGTLGHNLPEPYLDRKLDGSSLYASYPDVNLTVTEESSSDGRHMVINWEGPRDLKLMDCFKLGDKQWFGGPQQKHQYWPIQKLELAEYSYIGKEADNAAIAEPYWLSSNGFFVYVDKTVPLFVDQNNILPNQVCFLAKVEAPYSSQRQKNILKYSIGKFSNARTAHKYAIKKFLGKPTGYPDERMTQHPIWSTWAKYKALINESSVLEFAQQILDNNFKNGQYEIDDKWEVCYGSFTVDTNPFPDLKALNLKLKEMGFRVTMWIHPFINKDCDPWYTDARDKGYLVRSESGSYDTQWWNSAANMAAYVDFTNTAAAKWWYDRLVDLRNTYEVDSYKFDAGETSWSPQIPVQVGDVYEHPAPITQDYVRTCAKFGSLVEVRSGQRTQDLPFYVRMIDKDSNWDFENGLPTLITTLLQMNMNGYPLVLPDMIGGNGYQGAPDKEMFIRWLQANTFMPSLQYSYVPWDYDAETIAISHTYTDLHSAFISKIMTAFKRAVSDGEPVNPPIWWIDPDDQEALRIWDEYLLGEDILVAPVIVKGATQRDIYLPKGKWLAQGKSNQDKIYIGPRWLMQYPAPLDTLPYFILEK